MLWRFRIVMSRVFAVFISRASFILELHLAVRYRSCLHRDGFRAFVLGCRDEKIAPVD